MFGDLTDSTSNQINNIYIIGILMIIINIGSRYIIEEFSPYQKKMLNNNISRKIFIFCVFLMATKNILVSIILLFILYVVVTIMDNTSNKNKDKNNNDKKGKILDEMKMILSKHSI